MKRIHVNQSFKFVYLQEPWPLFARSGQKKAGPDSILYAKIVVHTRANIFTNIDIKFLLFSLQKELKFKIIL